MAEVRQLTTKAKEKNTPKEMKVRSRFIRTTPDKLRFVSRGVLGKEINEAINALMFFPQTARIPLISVLKAGLSQAKDHNIDSPLYVKAIAVDEGPKLKRRRVVQQGRAIPILKRMSHITIFLTVNKPAKKEKNGSQS